MSDYNDDAGVLSGAILDQTRSEDWARYTPRTTDVRQRGAALRRRRHVGTPVGVVGLVTVLAGGVVSMTGGLGGPGGAAATTSAGAAAGSGPSPTATSGATGTPTPQDFQKVLEGAVQIGSGTLGDHAWTVKVAVFASAADLKQVYPRVLWNDIAPYLPASGPVWVSANYDHGKQGGIGARGLPAQPPAIAVGKPAMVDPWYAANLGVVTAVVDPRVDHYAVTSGGTTTTYHTVEVKGFRFITFPITGPGDVTRIVAYDAAGTVLDQGAGHYLPYGVYPYQLPPTDSRRSVGAWG